MNKYEVTVYEATHWSMFTQGDHFNVYTFETTESLTEISRRLAKDGFPANSNEWVMPGAILKVKKV